MKILIVLNSLMIWLIYLSFSPETNTLCKRCYWSLKLVFLQFSYRWRKLMMIKKNLFFSFIVNFSLKDNEMLAGLLAGNFFRYEKPAQECSIVFSEVEIVVHPLRLIIFLWSAMWAKMQSRCDFREVVCTIWSNIYQYMHKCVGGCGGG